MKKYFILAAAAAMFAACSNNEDLAQGETPTERIPLTIGTTSLTGSANGTMRSSTIDLQDDAITSYTSMGLYIMQEGKTSKQSVAYEWFNLQSSSLTASTPATGFTKFVFSDTKYYPDTKSQGLDIYAYAPYNASAPNNTNDIASDELTLETPTTQTYDADFYEADFLWGCVGAGTSSTAQTNITDVYTAASATATVNASITAENAQAAKNSAKAGYYSNTTASPAVYTQNVVVPMIHLGSKIIIKVKTDESMSIDKIKGATVTFLVPDKDATLNLSTGDLTPGTANNATVTMGVLGYSAASTPITAGNATGSNGVLWDSTNDTNSDGNMDDDEVQAYLCSGVILPQTAAASTKLIGITLSDGLTQYAYAPTAAITFVGSKKYTFDITVKASGINVTTTVADWTAGTAIPAGEATLE